MPKADVRVRHEAVVDAPAELVFATACDTRLGSLPLVRGLFRLREILLGAKAAAPISPQGIVDEMLALGWVRLGERPGRELVMGAVTKPWEPDVVFRSVEPARFRDFSEPGFVKIAWTLETDPVDSTHSLLRTQTRAMGTDRGARSNFRRYWRAFKVGIILIRWSILLAVRREAQRRFRLRVG